MEIESVSTLSLWRDNSNSFAFNASKLCIYNQYNKIQTPLVFERNSFRHFEVMGLCLIFPYESITPNVMEIESVSNLLLWCDNSNCFAFNASKLCIYNQYDEIQTPIVFEQNSIRQFEVMGLCLIFPYESITPNVMEIESVSNLLLWCDNSNCFALNASKFCFYNQYDDIQTPIVFKKIS